MHPINKIVFTALLTFAFSITTLVAQNDTLYIMKNGAVVGQYNLNNQVDSLIFYKPTNAIIYVNIPAGTFTMGSPTTEVGRSINETQFQVTLSSFRMSKYVYFCIK